MVDVKTLEHQLNRLWTGAVGATALAVFVPVILIAPAFVELPSNPPAVGAGLTPVILWVAMMAGVGMLLWQHCVAPLRRLLADVPARRARRHALARTFLAAAPWGLAMSLAVLPVGLELQPPWSMFAAAGLLAAWLIVRRFRTLGAIAADLHRA